MRSPNAIALRTVEDLADAKQLRSVITTILAGTPIDGHALRCAVSIFVVGERTATVPPALVITRLIGLVDDATGVSVRLRAELTRQVILWCVEDYFRDVGGDVPMDASRGAPPLAMRT